MKLVLIKKPIYPTSTEELFTLGKCYDGDLTPIEYDPQTLQPAPASYVVRCDDGYMRKVDALYFITLEELRQKKLEELGI
jgi:hypothetical protein